MKFENCGLLNVGLTQTDPARIHPAPKPEPPELSSAWIDIALKLCGIVAVLESMSMIYLVWVICR